MAFFDGLGSSLAKGKQDVTQKAKELTEVTKLKLSINEDEKKLNEVYLAIGKQYCKTYGGADGLGEPFASMTAAVTQLIRQQSEKKKRIQYLQKSILCPKCQAECSMNTRFCTSCGTGLESVIAEFKKGFCCPVCGKEIEQNTAFCTSCGTKIEK